MGSQWGRDKVYQKAMKQGYRSRASFKLKEILERNAVLRPQDNVVDLGAAPGSWLQILKENTSGQIVGIDLNPIQPLEGVITLVGDFSKPTIVARVLDLLPVVNLVVCDASPKLSGHKSYDQARAIDLNKMALDFAIQVLCPGGNLVMKTFQGEDFPWIYRKVKDEFFRVTTHKTHSSRKGSAEVYIIARNFIAGRDDLLDPNAQEEVTESGD
ncbi:MAG TPA: RlmE family RNA methyltransferase [Methanospirillum sp.]|uniref:RlmE family RNA methyltransferase n=1 Tax=Methanospirillum sp. TaxID=45200 RepID=UPI002D0177A4|nr:RlmE family RNA methyltransferase [Methanospirillum sp.]HWQ63179.1 RlmE family RNA methyltransferase [Methanospirillum sp.]